MGHRPLSAGRLVFVAGMGKSAGTALAGFDIGPAARACDHAFDPLERIMAKPSEPVVVGTDGSAAADRALEWAADEALRRNRPLRIVHAVTPWRATVLYPPPPDLPVALEEAGRSVLDEAEQLVRKRHPQLEVTTAMILRSPGQGMREQAETAFETVVGDRGAGGFARLMLGSTALWLAGRVPGTVIVVRGDAHGPHAAVVAGIDPAAETGTVLEYAFEVAELRGARLRIVHGWRPPAFAEAGYAFDAEDVAEHLRQAIQQATVVPRDRHPGVEATVDVVQDHPVHALAEASREADLLVVGARDRHALVLGSVSHGVVHHAHCPVAVVRPRGAAEPVREGAS